jgi:hypothetical protein
MHDQIIPDSPMMRVQAPSVDMQREGIEVLPIFWMERPSAAYLGKLFQQLFRRLVHGLLYPEEAYYA